MSAGEAVGCEEEDCTRGCQECHAVYLCAVKKARDGPYLSVAPVCLLDGSCPKCRHKGRSECAAETAKAMAVDQLVKQLVEGAETSKAETDAKAKQLAEDKGKAETDAKAKQLAEDKAETDVKTKKKPDGQTDGRTCEISPGDEQKETGGKQPTSR